MQYTWRVLCRNLVVLCDRQGVLSSSSRQLTSSKQHLTQRDTQSVLSADGGMPPRKPKPKNPHARRKLGVMRRYSAFKRKSTPAGPGMAKIWTISR